MSKTYRIKQASIFLWMVSFVGAIFIEIWIIQFLTKMAFIPSTKGKPILIVALIIPIIFFALKLQKYISCVDIEITIDNEGLKKKWLKQFPLQNRANLDINWADIKAFVFQRSRYFEIFKITLKDGTKFKLYHNTDHDDKDDFHQFQLDFESKIRSNEKKATANSGLKPYRLTF